MVSMKRWGACHDTILTLGGFKPYEYLLDSLTDKCDEQDSGSRG